MNEDDEIKSDNNDPGASGVSLVSDDNTDRVGKLETDVRVSVLHETAIPIPQVHQEV